MLTHIHIKNYTLVKALSLDLKTGLHVLTGETGAGKSIIVDAVSLALGARADTNPVGHGADQCDISLCFDVNNIPKAKKWLQKQQFDNDGECIIRRTINQDGRSRSTINANPCPQNLVRDFAELVLNIHGQHQQQALLKREIQQQQLDAFAHHEKQLQKIQQHFQQWKKINAELELLNKKTHDRDHQLELLRYQAEIKQSI